MARRVYHRCICGAPMRSRYRTCGRRKCATALARLTVINHRSFRGLAACRAYWLKKAATL